MILIASAGYFLKKTGIIGKTFVAEGNRLIFRFLLPIMLFTNVYNIENIRSFDFSYIIFALSASLAVFLLAVFSSGLITKEGPKRGSLIQGILRSNYALIGIPLAGSLFSAEGTAAAAVLSAFAIPLFNVLAVSELVVFCGSKEKLSAGKIVADILKNPLIQGVAAGFAILLIREFFIQNDISFRLFDIVLIEKSAGYISAMTTPLSLIVLGADFEFSAVPSLKKEIVLGTLLRCAFVPVFCLGTAFFCFRNVFSGAQFAALAALFSAPAAVSSVPMAQEMGADTVLMGQLVIWTTVFSAATVFIVSFLFKSAGIF